MVVALGGSERERREAGSLRARPTRTSRAGTPSGRQAFTAAALTPAEGHMIFAYVAIAVYDSVMAIEGGYEPFAVDVDAPGGASAEAAVAAAAHRVLAHYLPAQAPTIIDPAYAASLATIPDGQAKTNGVAVGESVAQLVIAQRSGDGFRAPVTYTPPNPPIPGVWLPTAPTPPIGTVPRARCGRSASTPPTSSGPNGPPALASKKWARDYNEVKEIGSSTSTTRTAEQTLAARFWAEPPVQQARGSFRKFVLDHELDVARGGAVHGDDVRDLCRRPDRLLRREVPLRVLAADHRDPRRRHGRQRCDRRRSRLVAAAAGDAEPPGVPERAFLRHPGRRARHRPSSSGRTQIDFTIPSLTGLGDRHYDRVKDLEYEVSNARIWGGIHYRSAVEDGIKIGKKTANQVLAHHFQKSND